MTVPAPLTVGVLYPGEMGAALAAALVARGVPVVTTARGRSAATAGHAARLGAVVLDSFADVVRASDVLFSLVLPSAAEDVAAQYCDAARLAPRHAIYVDANSIGPAKARSIGQRVESAGVGFVDASTNGLAKNLCTTATLYLSGPRAGDVAALCEPFMRVKRLGPEIGRASAMKMLLGGLSKGVCALFAELAVLAHEQGMLDEMLEATGRTYPGIAALAERMLPTYAQHAGRRATEMNELAATAEAAGVTPRAIRGVVEFHEALAAAIGPSPLSPVLGGEGRGEGPLSDHQAASGNGKSPSPRPSPLSTGERGNGSPAALADSTALASTVRLIADRLNEREVV
jgi:3-hydroxyisobutyrate dehydrogenase-like beta-hydroxyacid dehydrogenase